MLLVLLGILIVRNNYCPTRAHHYGDEAGLAGPVEGQPADVGTRFQVLPVQRDGALLAVGQLDRVGGECGVAFVRAEDGGINSCLVGWLLGLAYRLAKT